MPEGPDGKTIIIVKKVSGHGGAHGGAWKVAYADFVTAMMALFMVLWLVNSAAEPTRERIASYFRKPGVFDKGSGTPIDAGGAGILPDTFAPPSESNSSTERSDKIYKAEANGGFSPEMFDIPGMGKGGSSDSEDITGENAIPALPQGAKEKIESELRQLLEGGGAGSGVGEGAGEGEEGRGGAGALLGKVSIKVDQRGLAIEIMDTEAVSMFELGSYRIRSDAEKSLQKIAEVLKQLPNPIDIEGHTDARPFKSKSGADNWTLASDRAHEARRIIERVGLKNGQISRVVSYASNRLKVPSNPLDASNRRITIAMRFTEQANKALEGTQTVETAPRKLGKPTTEAVGSKYLNNGNSKKDGVQIGVQIDVRTTLPEGAPIPNEERGKATPTQKLEDTPEASEATKKDKIFDNRNPFFKF